jgi:2-hydroxy-6-oxonona-2,4-dienedioate hydrolase
MGVNEAKYRAAEARLWAHHGVVPQELWVTPARAGVRVRLQVIGEGLPVLFVHGASNSGTSWAPLAARLDGFRRILLDRPGCGLSAPVPTGFGDLRTFEAFADSLLVDILDALDIETADLVATSLGGYYALRAAAAHPDRINRVVECGWTVGAPIGRTPALMRVMTGMPRLGRLLSHVPVGDGAARAMLAHIGLREALDAGRVPDEVVGWWRAQLNHTATMRNEIVGNPPIMHPIRGMNDSLLLPDDVLRHVHAPALFLWGAGDLFGGAEVARRFTARLPNARLEVMPGGHAVWMDDAGHVATATRAFLAGAPGDADPPTE